MPYDKQTWIDSPSQATPISAARLQHIEDGIAAAEAEAVAGAAAAEAAAEAAQAAAEAAAEAAEASAFDSWAAVGTAQQAAVTAAAEAVAARPIQTGSQVRVLPDEVAPAEQVLKQAVWWIDASQPGARDQQISNLGWGGSALNARAGSVDSGLRVVPSAGYVALPGVAGNYLSVPDEAALDITGDIDIRVRVALDDWTPSAPNAFLGKYATTNGRAYEFRLETTGRLTLNWTPGADAAILTKTSSEAPTVADGSALWVRVTLDVDNGASGNDVKFWTSNDGSSWTQLGTTQTTAGVTSIANSADPLVIGSRGNGVTSLLAGKFYRAQVYNGIAGTLVLDIDCASAPTTYPDVTQFTALTGQMVSINDTSRDSNEPKFLDWDGDNYAYLPYVAANEMTVPAASGTYYGDDMDIFIDVALDDWQPGDAGLMGRVSSTASPGSYSWFLFTGTSNRVFFGVSDGTATLGSQSWSVLNQFTDGQRYRLRVHYVRNTGAGQFGLELFYKTDFATPLTDTTGWTSLGLKTGTSIGATYDGGWDTHIGTYRAATIPAAGKWYGAAVVVNSSKALIVDTSVIASGAATSFTALTGQTVTIARSASGRKTVAVTSPVFLLGTDDYLEVPARWVSASGGGLFLPGLASNYASAPDAAPLDITGDIDVRVKVALDDWTPGASPTLASKMGLAGNRSWNFGVLTGSGALFLVTYADGTNIARNATSSVATGLADGAVKWVRVTFTAASGDIAFYTSDDNVTYTQLGTTQTGSGATSLYSGSGKVEVGGYASGNSPAAGTFYRCQVYDGIAGTLAFDADFTGHTTGTASFTESSGNAATVTVNTSGSSYVAQLLAESSYVFPGGVGTTAAASSLLDFAAGDSFTVLAVYRRWNAETQSIIGKTATVGSTALGYAINTSTTTVRATIGDGTRTLATIGTDALGARTVAVLTRNVPGDIVAGYLNGVSGTPVTDSTTATLANVRSLYIGMTNADYFAGEGFAFAVFRKVLTADEIAVVTNYFTGRIGA